MNALSKTAVAAIALVLPMAVFAQTAVSKSEARFASNAASGGLTEIQASQLALKTSQNADVKTFAQKMVDDHTKAGDALSAVATKDSLTLPTAPTKHEQASLDKLGKLTGADFDKAYTKMMVGDHDKTAKALQKEISGGKDTNLVGWAKDTLPTVQSHDDMAHQLQTKVTS